MNAIAAAEASRPAAATASHPLLRAWSFPRQRLPGLGTLERLRTEAVSADGIARPTFVAQTRALLADGLHYEERIATCDRLATREHDAHDAFNALAWVRHPCLKWALNARQVADIAAVGPRHRTRGQCAMTHFDEAGAIAWLGDGAVLAAWDAHDWHALFVRRHADWGRRIAVTVFGHALLEHLWRGHALPVAKCLVVRADAAAIGARAGDAALVERWPAQEAAVAQAIRRGDLLADPQELRPLPLAGLPGWHAGDTATLVATASCFRPVRSGRRYPAPWPAG